jgi:hypothetical protein
MYLLVPKSEKIEIANRGTADVGVVRGNDPWDVVINGRPRLSVAGKGLQKV